MNDLKATLEAGKGIMDIRALIASIVGPHRLPHGTMTSHVLDVGKAEGVKIGDNIAVADCISFLGIALEQTADDEPEEGRPGLLSTTDIASGVSSSWPVFFFPSANSHKLTALLLPGEQLFAYTLGESCRIIVSEVQFR